MISKRLKTIATFIEKNDSVIDIGCDHGYLCIYLKKNNLCKNVIASDISENALNYAINNFKKEKLDINCYISDGFKNIKEFYDTAVIAGMGTHTIIDILSIGKIPKKIILASNNDYYLLRTFMQNLGFYLQDEVVVYDNKKYYPIMHYIKSDKKISNKELKFGKSKNKDYFNYLISKNKEILKKVPFSKKMNLIKENYILKQIIRSTEKK